MSFRLRQPFYEKMQELLSRIAELEMKVAFQEQTIEFKLDNLIPAWKEAIPMLKKGGKMQIVVPPEQGYGSRAAGKIPPNSTLVFDIELLDFHSDAK